MTSTNTGVMTPRFQLWPEKIPALLKGIDRWVMWDARAAQANGKFSKIPVNKRGWPVNALMPENWHSFHAALAAYEAGECDGIGFALDGTPIAQNGNDLYLIALDFDNVGHSVAEMRKLWLNLGRTYCEVSPSGKGLRMFALSREFLRGGNDGNGHEIYSTRRFVTVTGHVGKGAICDATAQLRELHDSWLPESRSRQSQKAHPPLTLRLGHTATPESEDAIGRVKTALSHLSADCSYEDWRNIVWSVLSTEWSCALDLARAWSMTVPARYDHQAFDSVARSFKPGGGITLGTLYHHAGLAGWVPHASEPAKSESRPSPTTDAHQPARFELLTAADVKARPISAYRVRGLLPAEGLAAIYGPSGSGKSFLILDLCFAIASGREEWFGKKVKMAPVLYIALEGTGGLRNRVLALEAHYGRTVPENCRLVLGGFSLMSTVGVEELARLSLDTLGPGCVVVIDTLNQAAPGADENASHDMGAIIAATKLLSERLHGLVILVHHTGKDATKGLRGHSSLAAALDAAIEVENKGGIRSWSATKAKDDEIGGRTAFQLKPYMVSTDEDGLTVTSCAVEPALLPSSPTKPLSGKNQVAAMGLLRQAIGGKAALPETKAVEVAAAVLTCAPGRRRTQAKELIDRLVAGAHLCRDEGGISLP
jgi:hypothetical protein